MIKSLVALIGFGAVTGILLLVFKGSVCKSQIQALLAGTMIAGAFAAGLWLRRRSQLKIARLITENPILCIRTVVISDLSAGAKRPENSENTEVIISYFGLLLGEKVIKFNQDGIRIRAVEIGGDFISFTYGTEDRTQNIRLLRPSIEPAELDQIVEKLRYETGITPVFVN